MESHGRIQNYWASTRHGNTGFHTSILGRTPIEIWFSILVLFVFESMHWVGFENIGQEAGANTEIPDPSDAEKKDRTKLRYMKLTEPNETSRLDRFTHHSSIPCALFVSRHLFFTERVRLVDQRPRVCLYRSHFLLIGNHIYTDHIYANHIPC